MAEYEVVENNCRCHPETCCCDKWKIEKSGVRWLTVDDLFKAREIANALNLITDSQWDGY